MKSDVLRDLPKKECICVQCEMTPSQRALYDAEVNQFRSSETVMSPSEDGGSAVSSSAASSKGAGKRGRKSPAPKPKPPATASATAGRFKNLYARLRRICGHPMMTQSKFKMDDYRRLSYSRGSEASPWL